MNYGETWRWNEDELLEKIEAKRRSQSEANTNDYNFNNGARAGLSDEGPKARRGKKDDESPALSPGASPTHATEAKTFATMVHEHSHMLISPDTCLPWDTRDPWIGLSSFSYGLPIVYLDSPIMIAALVLQVILSFLSDCIYSGRTSYTHSLDRILATTLTTISILRAFHHLTFEVAAILSFIPLTCFYLGKQAIAKRNWNQFRLWHSLWHISGGLALMYLNAIVQRRYRV